MTGDPPLGAGASGHAQPAPHTERIRHPLLPVLGLVHPGAFDRRRCRALGGRPGQFPVTAISLILDWYWLAPVLAILVTNTSNHQPPAAALAAETLLLETSRPTWLGGPAVIPWANVE